MDNKKRILHIPTDNLNKLEPRQIAFETGNEGTPDIMSDGVWGGKNSSGHVTRWTEYNKKARFDKVYLKDRITITRYNSNINDLDQYDNAINIGRFAGYRSSAADINIGTDCGRDSISSYEDESMSQDPMDTGSISIGYATMANEGNNLLNIGFNTALGSRFMPPEIAGSYDGYFNLDLHTTSGRNATIGFFAGGRSYDQECLTIGSDAGGVTSKYRTISIGAGSTELEMRYNGVGYPERPDAPEISQTIGQYPWITSADDPDVLLFHFGGTYYGDPRPEYHINHYESCFIGSEAGVGSMSQRVVGLGNQAFISSMGVDNVAVGAQNALRGSKVSRNVAVGSQIDSIWGYDNILIGSKMYYLGTLQPPTINDFNDFDYFRDHSSKWGHNVFIGGNNVIHISNYDVCIGWGAGTLLGQSVDTHKYAERNVLIGQYAGDSNGYTYGMKNAICIGDHAGGNTHASLENSVIIGNDAARGAIAVGDGVCIGLSACYTANAANGVVIGNRSLTNGLGRDCIILGNDNSINDVRSDDVIIIGSENHNESTSTTDDNIIIGRNNFNFSNGNYNVIMGESLYNNVHVSQTLNLNEAFIGNFADGRFGTDKSVVTFTPLSAAPSTPDRGELYYDSTQKGFYCWDGSVWNKLEVVS